MKINFIILFIIIVTLSACKYEEVNQYIKINDVKIKVEIADTPQLHYQGLSHRESLCKDCGMLFIFKDKKERTFVMRDMNFPIDIIWIDDNKIVGIEKNLQPEGSSPTNFYNSNIPINFVLEVNTGLVDNYNININNFINYSL